MASIRADEVADFDGRSLVDLKTRSIKDAFVPLKYCLVEQ
jgi:hypothetical protein